MISMRLPPLSTTIFWKTYDHAQRGAARYDLKPGQPDGWRNFVQAPKRVPPEELSKPQIRRLTDAAADIYNQRSADWHNNLGSFKTPQLVAVHEELWVIMDSSTQDGNRAKGAVAIDGYPGVGKTCAGEEIAKQFHQREICRHGEFTRAGDERWPVCRIGMRGNTSMKDFNAALCDFYAHPGRRGATAEQLGRWALDCVLSCETRLLIIDITDRD
jgi:AAA domain